MYLHVQNFGCFCSIIWLMSKDIHRRTGPGHGLILWRNVTFFNCLGQAFCYLHTPVATPINRSTGSGTVSLNCDDAMMTAHLASVLKKALSS